MAGWILSVQKCISLISSLLSTIAAMGGQLSHTRGHLLSYDDMIFLQIGQFMVACENGHVVYILSTTVEAEYNPRASNHG